MSSIRRQAISVLTRQRGAGNLVGFQVPDNAVRGEMDAALRVPPGSACCMQSLLEKAGSLVLRSFASIRHPPETPNCMR